jgi:glycosyltransferase involved in cell wall biosynthesis
MSGSNQLVSVIIPCFNAECWVGEAIDSCLRQTHRSLEIIVIDDGSTDCSPDILRSYGAQIRWESTPRHGGGGARNRGVSLSAGKYIQFLDADDYLLPEKIERQVIFLEETGAGVVYGDWRHQYHKPDGRIVLGDVQESGLQADVLEALLGGWWSANMTLLLRREVVVKCGGWDEALGAGQDRDFFISIAMSGADVRYQPGCCSVYRRYGNVTVSTASLQCWLENQWRLLDKAQSKLGQTGRLSARYRRAMARSYFHLARNYFDIDRAKYAQVLKAALSLDPGFRPGGSAFYRLIQGILGFEQADKLASHKRKIRNALRTSDQTVHERTG